MLVKVKNGVTDEQRIFVGNFQDHQELPWLPDKNEIVPLKMTDGTIHSAVVVGIMQNPRFGREGHTEKTNLMIDIALAFSPLK